MISSNLVEGRLAVGGLFGKAFQNININKSYSTNTVISNGYNGGCVGGLIGDASWDVTISESYSSSIVQSNNHENIGGLVGLDSGDGLVISRIQVKRGP